MDSEWRKTVTVRRLENGELNEAGHTLLQLSQLLEGQVRTASYRLAWAT